AIFAATGHTCAFTEPPGLAPYCWGLNTSGEVGDGTTTNRPSPVPVAGALNPLDGFSAGAFHSCALTQASGGAAYCWGRNEEGELGDGTTTSKASPVAVGGGRSFTAIATGYYHTCGLTAAGAVFCWGFNRDGGVGDGTSTNKSTPVAVAGGLTFTAISAGGNHTCGTTSTGAAYCWGSNTHSEVGDGTMVNG